ncbi:hypothetical protein J6590_105991 [Homalodisca vitripennis]|nr:hypothetical protein J6590_105991 [Homalodisca vitripennis]
MKSWCRSSQKSDFYSEVSWCRSGQKSDFYSEVIWCRSGQKSDFYRQIVAVPARNISVKYTEFVVVPAKAIGISTVNLVPLGTPTILYRQMGKWKPYKVVTKRVLLVTDSHGRELHHLLERSSEYAVTAIVSPNGTLNYITDNALLYQDTYDEVIVMAGTNDINDQGYVNNDFFDALGKLCLN